MGLASSYRKFTKNFWSITSDVTDYLKKGTFQWTEKAEESFRKVKILLQSEPVLKLPDFNLLFELECDTCTMGIGAVLTPYSLFQ